MSRSLVLTLALLGSALANSATLPEPVKAALADLAHDSDTAWAYTRETRDDIGHYLERFDPALPREQQWQLLAFEGGPPTEKHLRRYQKHYDELFERDSPTEIDFDDLIDPATVVEHSRSDDGIVYEFQPLGESREEKKVMQHLRGTILIGVPDHRIRSFSIRLIEKFSPIAMLRITAMSMEMEFAPVNEDGRVVIVAMRVTTEGRFMRIKKFSESEAVDYRDFEQRDLRDATGRAKASRLSGSTN